MSTESNGGVILTGENQRTLRKPCPNATLPTVDPTWTDAGANPGEFGLRMKKLQEDEENYIMRSFIIYVLRQTSLL
jgi:hypothetical protein